MKKTVYGIVALLCFGALLAAGFLRPAPTGQKKGYDMVVLGDSIFGQTRDDTSIPAELSRQLGTEVFNGALGGTCMGRLEETRGSSRTPDVLSMVGLSKAILSGDFRMQESFRVKDMGTEYFPEVIAGLQEIDFNQVEVLLIGHCVNDYHTGETIYPSEDIPEDEHTFAGALRSVVTGLQEKYPKLRIVLVTPPYTWYIQQGLSCEEYVLNGYILEDYVNAQLQLAEELDVEIIDLYHDVYPHETWEDWQRYSTDGVHPNEAGRMLLAGKIAEYLQKQQ